MEFDEVGTESLFNKIEKLELDFNGIKENGFSKYESYFRRDNISLYNLDVSKYSESLDSTISYLSKIKDSYKENEENIKKFGLENKLLKILDEYFEQITWVMFDNDEFHPNKKPTKNEIENQLRIYLGKINLNAMNFFRIMSKVTEFSKNNQAIDDVYSNYVLNSLKKLQERAEDIVTNLNKVNEFSKSRETIDIYKKAKFSYGVKAFIFSCLFLFFLISAAVFILFFDFNEKSFSFDVYTSTNDVSLTRILILRVPILLVLSSISLYFLKLSSYNLSKCEEAKKIYYELSAFPFYVSELSKEDINELRKSFAYHYFGKDVNYELFDRMSNASNNYIDMANKSMSTITEILKEKNNRN